MTEAQLLALLGATWPADLPGDPGLGGGDTLVAHMAPVARLAISPGSRLPAVPHWPPLAILGEIWEEAGLDPAAVAPMTRVAGPKTALLVRAEDLPAGAAFVAIHDRIAMIHLLQVRERLRRKGAASKMVRTAATWAQDVGATTFSIVTNERNLAARALCASLGMDVVGQITRMT